MDISCSRGKVQRRSTAGRQKSSPPSLYLDVAIQTPPIRPFSSPLAIQFRGLNLATGHGQYKATFRVRFLTGSNKEEELVTRLIVLPHHSTNVSPYTDKSLGPNCFLSAPSTSTELGESMSYLNSTTGYMLSYDHSSVMNLASNGVMHSRESENDGRWSAPLSVLEFTV